MKLHTKAILHFAFFVALSLLLAFVDHRAPSGPRPNDVSAPELVSSILCIMSVAGAGISGVAVVIYFEDGR